MSEPHRQQPRSRETIAELTLIVRPPGNPLGVKTFTNAQRDEAEAYAAQNGATVEPLED